MAFWKNLDGIIIDFICWIIVSFLELESGSFHRSLPDSGRALAETAALSSQDIRTVTVIFPCSDATGFLAFLRIKQVFSKQILFFCFVAVIISSTYVAMQINHSPWNEVHWHNNPLKVKIMLRNIFMHFRFLPAQH